jgi:hypothetical protein
MANRNDAALRQERYARRQLVDGRLVAPVSPEHHGKRWTYAHHGCRCPICTDAHAARQKRARGPGSPAQFTHGTLYGYESGCRCPACSAVSRSESRSKRAALFAERVLWHPRAPHGTPAGYVHYGCRCAPCTTANTVDSARRAPGRRNDPKDTK